MLISHKYQNMHRVRLTLIILTQVSPCLMAKVLFFKYKYTHQAETDACVITFRLARNKMDEGALLPGYIVSNSLKFFR